MSFGNFYIDCIVRIACSFVCGFLLGIERKQRQHSVGMRTLILISVSSTLLSLLSVYFAKYAGMASGDPTRIAAGVVTGIGFLGGGAILRQGLNIRGLTSAAVIWAASALGLAFGAGFYVPSVITLVVCLLSLILLEKVEEKYFPAEKAKSIKLIFEGQNVDIQEAKKLIKQSGVVIRDVNVLRSIKEDSIILDFSVKASSELDFVSLSKELESTGTLITASISE